MLLVITKDMLVNIVIFLQVKANISKASKRNVSPAFGRRSGDHIVLMVKPFFMMILSLRVSIDYSTGFQTKLWLVICWKTCRTIS